MTSRHDHDHDEDHQVKHFASQRFTAGTNSQCVIGMHPRRLAYFLACGSTVLYLFVCFIHSDRSHIRDVRDEHRLVENITLQVLFLGVGGLKTRNHIGLKDLPTSSMASLSNGNTVRQSNLPQQSPTTSDGGNESKSQFVLPQVEDDPNLPKFASLFDSYGNVTGDVQFLLAFAIIGFGKCGTSTLMYVLMLEGRHWLAQHTEVRCFQDEIWELMLGTVAKLVQMLYEQNQRCYKCPAEIGQFHIMELYRKHWPRTKLFIGIRHPVRWFESLYNFRVQNLPSSDDRMPHPNRLIGRCTRGMKHTCTDMGNFAYHLIRLGKQNWNGTRHETPLESKIVGRYRRARYNVTALKIQPNPIFLYAVEQLADTDATRQAQFRTDVQNFLHLSSPLPPLIHFSPGRQWTSAQQKLRDRFKIDICQEEYSPVRRELMRLSTQNSEWLRDFVTFPDVTVSSMEFVLKILDDWQRDPCTNETYREASLKIPVGKAVHVRN